MIKTNIKGIDLVFETSAGVFSPKGIDLGTLSMLSVVDFQETDRVLDLGCGYGVVDGTNHASIKVLENVGFRFLKDGVDGEFGKRRDSC